MLIWLSIWDVGDLTVQICIETSQIRSQVVCTQYGPDCGSLTYDKERKIISTAVSKSPLCVRQHDPDDSGPQNQRWPPWPTQMFCKSEVLVRVTELIALRPKINRKGIVTLESQREHLLRKRFCIPTVSMVRVLSEVIPA